MDCGCVRGAHRRGASHSRGCARDDRRVQALGRRRSCRSTDCMISRIPFVDPERLSVAGRDIYASILQTRGNVEGPFLVWLHSPGLAAPAEKLGAFCRYNTSLAKVESELLILTVAAHFRCTGEWQIHAAIALEAGLDSASLDARATSWRTRSLLKPSGLSATTASWQ